MRQHELAYESETLRAGERRVLEQIATGAELGTVLDTLCRVVEEQVPGMLCSILLLDVDGKHLRHGAAPSLPGSYVEPIDGLEIGPRAGSCGTAAHTRQPVIVRDIGQDPRWEDYRELGLAHGLRACWSTPVFDSEGELLGTFAMYYGEPRQPGPRERRLIELATHLAGIAIEHASKERALEEAQTLYRSLYEEVPVGLYRSTPDGAIVDANQALVKMLRYPDRETLLTVDAVGLYERPEQRERWQREFELHGEIRDVEQRLRRYDGTLIWVRDNAQAVKDEKGRVLFYEGTLEDITASKRSEEALRESETKFRTLFEQSKDAVYIVDRYSRLIEANGAALELSGYPREEAIGLDVREAFYASPHELERFRAEMRRTGWVKNFEVKVRRRDGETLDCLVTYNPMRDGAGRIIGYQGIVRDVSAQKRLQAQLSYLAHRDPLTGLFNRRRFEEELERRVRPREGERRQPSSLLWLDLDRFKEINDSLGHRAGDELLNAVAGVLRDSLREGDIVARIGGDEFAVLCVRTRSDEATAVARKLLQVLEQTTTVVAGQPLRVTASLGIASYPEHGLTAEELMARADLAMYRAKEEGRNTWRVYPTERSQEAELVSSLEWAQRIRSALEEGRMRLHAQSIYELRSDRVYGCELLLRLADGERLIHPRAFLDTAERFSLMEEIHRWVVEEAMRHAAEHHRLGRPVRFAINLSGQAIAEERLLERIETAMREAGVEPGCLTFEITETAAITRIHEAKRFIQRLRELGCKFALDDFGVGFSSFYHLKHLPVDYLKIDGSFIRHLAEAPMDGRIVRAIVDIARSLGMATIAECVEDDVALRMLKDLGVDYAQGFHLERPRPLADWLAANASPTG